MRFGSLSIPMLLCLALVAVPGTAVGQTDEGWALPDESADDQPWQEPTGTNDRPWEEPAPVPEEPVEGPAEPPAGEEPVVGTPAEPTGWGEPVEGSGEQPDPGWGAPPEASGWGETPTFELPEDQRVGYWPLLLSLGAGYGLTFEGTKNQYASAVTVQPTVFLGLLKHFGVHHGPALSVPIGMPGIYERDDGNPVTIDTKIYGVSFAVVPGYQLVHFFRRDMFWGAGVGAPLLWAEQQGAAKLSFTPGFELNAQFGYKFLAGLGVFLRASWDIFPAMYDGSYDISTLGGELGLCLYYDWFRPWEPPQPQVMAEDLP